MKKLTIVFLLLISAKAAFSQTSFFNEYNSIDREAIVIYEKDAHGFYHRKENVKQTNVNAYIGSYAYDKKNHKLYVKSYDGNYVVTVKDNDAKVLKKNKTLPKLEGEKLNIEIEKINTELDEKFITINANRQKEIEETKAKAIAKAKADSILKIREDSIRKVRKAEEIANYRKSHKWNRVPVIYKTIQCPLCNENITINDSVTCIGIKNDTIYYAESKYWALGVSNLHLHQLAIPDDLKKYEPFNYHIEVFKDSLNQEFASVMDSPNLFNYLSISRASEEIKRIAPYGYFEYWKWDEEYGYVSFDFKYTNTNKNTIKYIDVYWRITNDVNDVRNTGHFKGTGPLGEWETASWDWDTSLYRVAGDATHMDITKVIITYMNGTTKVLNKSMLRFN